LDALRGDDLGDDLSDRSNDRTGDGLGEEVVDLIDEAVVDQVNCCVENGHGFLSFSQRDSEVYM